MSVGTAATRGARRVPPIAWSAALAAALVSVVMLHVLGPLAAYAALPVLIVGIVLYTINPPVYAAGAALLYLLVHLLIGDDVLFHLGEIPVKGAQFFGAVLTVSLALRCLPMLVRSPLTGPLLRLTKPLLLYVLSMLVAFVGARDFGAAATVVFYTIGTVAALMFGYLTGIRPGALSLYRGALQAAGLFTALSTFHEIRNPEVATNMRAGALRAGGVFGRANLTSDLILVTIPTALVEFRRRASYLRWLIGAFGLVVGVLGLIATFTRAPIIGLAIFLVLFLGRRGTAQSPGMSRRRFGALAAVLAAGAIAMFFVDRTTLESRLSDVPLVGSSAVTDPGTGSGRVRIWTAVLTSMSESGFRSWIVGHGLLSTLDATGKRLNSSWLAHNSYLEVLHNQGLVGLGFMIWWILTLLRALRAAQAGGQSEWARAYFCLLIAFSLTVDMFTSSVYMFVARWYLYLFIGAILGHAAAARSSTSNGGHDAA